MDKRFADIRLPYVFLALTLVFMLVTGLTALLGDRMGVQLALNAYHRPWLDTFMRYYTKIGEAVPYVVAIGLLFYKAGWSLFLVLDLALAGLIVQPLKYLFGTLRPLGYVHLHCPEVSLPLVEGVRMGEFYSFPSGHTVSIFVLFLTLSVIVSNAERYQSGDINRRWDPVVLQCLFFLLAALGAYSRIYLNMHWVEDLFGGALFATLFTLLLLFLTKNWHKKAFFGWKIKKMRVK